MYFERMSKQQKLDYIYSVIYGVGFVDEKIIDISYTKLPADKSGPASMLIQFSALDECDEEKNYEIEVFDYCTDKIHTQYFAKIFGMGYLHDMYEYAKKSKDHVLMSAAKNATETYIKNLNTKQTVLSDFDNGQQKEVEKETQEKELKQKTLYNYTEQNDEIEMSKEWFFKEQI